jgi:hypothetical protein
MRSIITPPYRQKIKLNAEAANNKPSGLPANGINPKRITHAMLTIDPKILGRPEATIARITMISFWNLLIAEFLS